jgi:5-methylcytosine-specific restriction endonuclease McrA
LDGLDFYCSDCQSQKKHEKSAHHKAVLIANPIQETHKKCSTCKSVKSVMDFYADFRNQDGLCSQCSACMMITTIEWQKKNPDKVKKIGMDWAAANPQKVAAKGKKYRQNHPEVMRIHYQTRRSRKKSCGGKLSKGIVSKLLKLQHGKCACCGSQLVLLPSGKVDGKHVHIDHIMPLAKGGTNTDSNVQLLTSRCNLQKKDRHPVDFMQSRGFLL